MKPDADPSSVKLTSFAKSAGCAAKIAPGTLSRIVSGLPRNTDPALIVGTETSDDAAVYALSDTMAMVQTVDFFPPVVDDPYLFGQIAAANALSDVYAMGGEPVTALNIVAFPSCLGEPVLAAILRGGADKVHEAGASIAGGHSINIEEPLYGLAVTGIIDPRKIRKNFGARPGDTLILTKPLGTGLVNTAAKADMAEPESVAQAVKSMTTLNRATKRVLDNFTVHACTDVTGFSLAGHGREMATASNVSLHINAASLPVITGAVSYAEMGLVPQGTYNNRQFVGEYVSFEHESDVLSDLIFDPQTSGGLLISVPTESAAALLDALASYDGGKGIGTQAAAIGTVSEFDGTSIHIAGELA